MGRLEALAFDLAKDNRLIELRLKDLAEFKTDISKDLKIVDGKMQQIRDKYVRFVHYNYENLPVLKESFEFCVKALEFAGMQAFHDKITEIEDKTKKQKDDFDKIIK